MVLQHLGRMVVGQCLKQDSLRCPVRKALNGSGSLISLRVAN